MKNNKSYFKKLFFILLTFSFSLSSALANESAKRIADKQITAYKESILEIEKELKDPTLTDNELKFFHDKLLKILESITNQKNEYDNAIQERTTLLEGYSLALFKKDKDKAALSSNDDSIGKYKNLREEISAYKSDISSIKQIKDKIELLLNDIAYEGLRNRTKGLFTFNTPFYKADAWIDGYADMIELYHDAKTGIKQLFGLSKVVIPLLVLLVLISLFIYVYVKGSIRLLKFLLSKLECGTIKEITGYKELVSEKSFFIFIRFLICAYIPIFVLEEFFPLYFRNYLLLEDNEGLVVSIIFDTLKNIWIMQAIASTYFIKKLGLLPISLIKSRTLKLRIYFLIYLLGTLCFINDVDIVNVAVKFNPMVYPNGAAIMNLFVGTLISINILFLISYVNFYMQPPLRKKSLIFFRFIKGVLILFTFFIPITIFIGASNLPIEITLDIAQSLTVIFFFYYLYHSLILLIPLIINSIVLFFNKIAVDNEEMYIEHEYEAHRKHRHSKDLLKYLINTLVLAGVIVLAFLEILVIWGFPANTLSRISKAILFEQIYIGGKPTFSISILLVSLFSGIVVYYIFKIIQYILDTKIFPHTRLDDGTRHAFKTTIGYIGLLFASIVFVYTLGVSMTALTFIISGLSIGIGFSLQELFKNFFSGFVLLIERPIKIGDILSVNGHPAKVKKIRIRCTILESSEKDIIVIPNSELVNNKVINETTFPLSRIEIGIDIAYSENPVKVAELLKSIADTHSKISKTFGPHVEFAKFNDYSVTLVLKIFVKRTEKDEVASDLRFMLFNALKENKIAMSEIPPSRVYIKEINWDKKDLKTI